MIAFTLISNTQRDALDSGDLPLAKTFTLDADGTLQKTTAAHLHQGRAERKNVANLAEYARFRETLRPHQILTYGITEQLDVPLVTQDELSKHPGSIARDRKHFAYRVAPAILFIDHDPAPDAPPLTPDEQRNKLIEACPALARAPMIAQASSSSFIYNNLDQLKGPGGWHFYIAVVDGSDIPRAGVALYEHTWRIGAGYYLTSAAGTLLDRSLIDKSVWQPEREDFSCAKCIAPLEQRRPAVQAWNIDAPLFDTRQIIEPTPEEKEVIEQKRAEARGVIEPERRRVRDSWVAERKQSMEARGVVSDIAQRTAELAADTGALLGDFELRLENGQRKTVSEILANRNEHHGQRCADPLEPDYRRDYRIGYLNLYSGGRPHLFSHAHGGQRFDLYPQTKTLTLQRGELTAHTYAALDLMKCAGDLYDVPTGEISRKIVQVRDGSIIPLNEVNLRTYLGKIIRCQRLDKRTGKLEPADIPIELVKAIFEEPLRGLPLLEAVISDPVMRADGSLLDSPGYHEKDRLLFESTDIFPTPIVLDPTEEQIRDAIKLLWRPFRDFPFRDDTSGGISRGVMMAALLTAVVRPTLPTSPAFLFEAPSAGSGKTLLAKCVAALMTGKRPVAETPPATEEESKKALFAALRCGQQTIIWDNLTQPVYGNSSLCAFLTAPTYGDRVLGVSKKEELPNKAMLLMTGNNPQVHGDACRRVLVARIDAEIERPSMRVFDIEPEAYVLDHRRELRTAALTILRGFQSRGAPKQTRDTAGSFETWDRMVRQCVIWLGRNGFMDVELGDPYASALKNIELDPQAETVLNVMQAWRAVFRDAWKSPGEVIQASTLSLANTPEQSALAEAIRTIDSKGISPTGLGRWLQKHHDERIGGLRIATYRDPRVKVFRYAVLLTKPVLVPDRSQSANDAYFAGLKAGKNGDLA